FWRTPQARAGGGLCVHPLLVYADLLSIDDDRTREIAQSIYDRYLHTLIETV
ncbi:MAG TPA: type IV toxin-antitoxin system AbiEi family antitoxin, partial [Armatimonadota bacterium]|nr:type IV toxin-antitoxin system AbiEi family antitoxin [Armatimonadota bacterium]